MEKNWLIRTRQKQILGPIGRQKLLELLSKNLLAQDDEICSGNGHWFYVKEKSLMEKYIYEGIKQSFNPISEAKDVLNIEGTNPNSHPPHEATDAPNSSLESTVVLKMPPKTEKVVEAAQTSIKANQERRAKPIAQNIVVQDEVKDHFPQSTDLEYPASEESTSSTAAAPPVPRDEAAHDGETSKHSESSGPKKKIKTDPALLLKLNHPSEDKTDEIPHEFSKTRNDYYLFYILIVMAIVVLVVVFYYRKILNRPLPFLSDANAQELFLNVHKKYLLSDFSLKSQLGEINFSQNIFGMMPETHNERPKDCPNKPWTPVDSFFVLLAQNKKEWADWCNKCRAHLGDETKVFELLNMSMSYDSQKEISGQLKHWGYDISGLEIAFKTLDENAKVGAKIVLAVDQLIESLSIQEEKSFNPQALSLWHKRINSIEHENVMVPLLSSILAIRHHNRGMAQKLYQQVFALGPWDIFTRPHFYSRVHINGLYNNLSKLLRYTKLHSLDQFYSNILFHHLAFLDGEVLARFLQDNARPLSLLDIRTHANSFVDSKIDPILWFDFLYRRSTENELNNFLSFLAMKDNELVDYNAAKGLFILHENGRQFLNEKYNPLVESLWQSSSWGNKVLALKAFEKNPSLQREITEKNQELSRPLFDVKRHFFRKMIQNGRGIFYALYNLYKLGDMDEKLLVLVFLR
ncbi:MAG: hypothetical protein HYV97_16015 [Bdellovibrio sp.]|nr:hypothetical protein [Bdellovibrio sp.]